MGDDSSCCLEQELERLLLEDESPLVVSTPRQRLEDARAMAEGFVLDCDGSLDCDDGLLEDHHCFEDGEEERVERAVDDGVDGVCIDAETKEEENEHEASTHLLQTLSRDMADSGEWRRFHDINHEGQGALAEMNVALGSLQQWRKQRVVEPTHCGLQHPSTAALEPLPAPQPSAQPQTAEANTSSEEGRIKARDMNNPLPPSAEEDPLLTLWQGHHLRAQEAAERLQKQLNSAPRPFDTNSSAVSAKTEVLPETAAKTAALHNVPASVSLNELAKENRVHALAQEQAPFQDLAQENGVTSEDACGDENRVLSLRREVESLEMEQLVENVRVQASDHAAALARETCDDDIWRGTQQSVGEMEGELAGFTEELDSLLLRLGLNGGEGIAEEEGDVAMGSGDERAPASDMHIDR